MAMATGRRRGYTAINGNENENVEEGNGEGEREKEEWWNFFMVGVGSIPNLYFPAGDFCELDVRASSLPARKRMGVILEQEIELVEV